MVRSKRQDEEAAGHDGATPRIRKKKKLSAAVADNAAADGAAADNAAADNAAADDAAADCAAALTPVLATSRGDEKSKKGSGAVQRLWSEEDEIAILKGVYEYRAKTGSEWNSDSNAFFEFIKGSLHVQVSRNQLTDKIRKLKKKFLIAAEKSKKGEDLRNLSRPHDLEAFELSKKIWGNWKPDEQTETINKGSTKGKVGCVVAGCGESESIPEFEGIRNRETAEKGSSSEKRDGVDVDGFCARYPYLMYAVETMVSQRLLGEFPNGLLLERVKAFGGDEAREWDDKWKAVQYEEVKLHLRKLSFIAEISEAIKVAMMN